MFLQKNVPLAVLEESGRQIVVPSSITEVLLLDDDVTATSKHSIFEQVDVQFMKTINVNVLGNTEVVDLDDLPYDKIEDIAGEPNEEPFQLEEQNTSDVSVGVDIVVVSNKEPVQLDELNPDPLPILHDYEGVNEEVPILQEEQQDLETVFIQDNLLPNRIIKIDQRSQGTKSILKSRLSLVLIYSCGL
ncbi:hypothetical protein K7X08_021554 [Anisodus acutangulus]|uniref:Uncharacterized protein n=1 Tax=Anisodus acutangulus TaxID=402998 RepID=A0A9Q1M875_9SOLA|nr:hypothetical protein K7X08_021554 [Anisodus acutangulus]